MTPFIKKYGDAACREAIRGAEHDAYEVSNRNGTRTRYDEWERIFNPQKHTKFDQFRVKAPDYAPTLAHLTMVEHAQDVAQRILERARLIEDGDSSDPIACAHLLVEVNRRIVRWLDLPNRPDAEGDDNDT